MTEGVPQAIVEALATGTPVVATDVGGVRAALAAGSAGMLVPPGDRDALVDAILRLVDDDALRCSSHRVAWTSRGHRPGTSRRRAWRASSAPAEPGAGGDGDAEQVRDVVVGPEPLLGGRTGALADRLYLGGVGGVDGPRERVAHRLAHRPGARRVP